LNNYEIVSAEIAKQLAEDQYAKYDAHRKLLGQLMSSNLKTMQNRLHKRKNNEVPIKIQ
jgi:hypothetical protein